MTTPPTGFNITPSVGVSEVHTNVDQQIIQITADKLTIILKEYNESQEKSTDWKNPLSIVITVVIVLLTTEFKTALFIDASTWKAIFIISLAACLIWLIRSIYHLRHKTTIPQVIERIKNKK